MSELEIKQEEIVEEVKKEPITVEIKYSSFFATSIIYLSLPVLIFFIFWLKIGWAIVFSGALIAAVVLAIKDQGKNDYVKLSDKSNEIRISPFLLVIMGIIACLWAFMSGIGEFAWASADHTVRAAVLNDLVNYKWPVVYDMSTQMNPLVSSSLPEGKATFAYYFTFWLVPALVGKGFGIVAARAALVVWSALGLYLIMILICFTQKRASFSAAALFIFFGGFDIVPYYIQTSIMNSYSTWEGWNTEMWIHGNFYQTMNTFHQCIPGWLITLILIDSRNNRHVGTTASLMFCYSPWATIGIFPIAIYELLASKWKDAKGKYNFKNIVSYGNLVIPVIVLAVFALFYTANGKATAIKGFIWKYFDTPGHLLLAYVGYVLVEFGIWAIIIYKDNSKNPLYWVALITLIVFPIYKMSEANDLLMRGTLPPMVVIFVLVLSRFDAVNDRFKKRGKNNDFKALGFFGIVFVMAITPFFFMTTEIGATREIYNGTDTSVQPQDEIVSFGNIVNEEYTEVTDRQFFVFEYEDKLFYQVFGKS